MCRTLASALLEGLLLAAALPRLVANASPPSAGGGVYTGGQGVQSVVGSESSSARPEEQKVQDDDSSADQPRRALQTVAGALAQTCADGQQNVPSSATFALHWPRGQCGRSNAGWPYLPEALGEYHGGGVSVVIPSLASATQRADAGRHDIIFDVHDIAGTGMNTKTSAACAAKCQHRPDCGWYVVSSQGGCILGSALASADSIPNPTSRCLGSSRGNARYYTSYRKTATAAGACEDCPTGTYNYAGSGELCMMCPPGRHQALAGQTGCDACPEGQSTAAAGSTGPASCVPFADVHVNLRIDWGSLHPWEEPCVPGTSRYSRYPYNCVGETTRQMLEHLRAGGDPRDCGLELGALECK